MLTDIEGGIEVWMRVAPLGGAELQIVKQRVHARFGNIAVVRLVPGIVEKSVGIALLVHAEMDVVFQRIEVGGRDVGITCGIPTWVEEYADGPG
jgi:hypothetical protein